MPQYDVLHNQWLMLAFIGGLGILLVFVLGYLAMWRRREEEADLIEEEAPPRRPAGAWRRGYVPWVLILVYVGMLAWGVGYLLLAAARPPNW